MRLTLSQCLDTRPRFKRAVDCDMCELESVLDFFAPYGKQKGNWSHNPRPQDPEETYRACYETLQEIAPEPKLTVAKYMRRALANKDNGSEEIVDLTKMFARHLNK